MKRIYLFFRLFCLVCLVASAASAEATVYCSSSQGSDSNSGSSASSPVKTIARALKLGNDVALRRGDVFYENIQLSGSRGDVLKIGAYGSGDRPKLCGLRIPAPDCHWTLDSITPGGAHIWRMTLTGGGWSGFAAYTTSSGANNVGAIVNLESGSLNDSRRVQFYNQLTDDFDFWQPYTRADGQPTDVSEFDHLYMCYNSGDPNTLPLGFSAGCTAIEVLNLDSGFDLRHIEVCFWGIHGIQVGSDATIEDCRVDAIGGSLATFVPASAWVTLGNGIECYIGYYTTERHNVLVRRNIVSRCFDCGLTAQGSDKQLTLSASNIRFERNLVFNCCQGWECFLRNNSDIGASRFIDSEVSNNVFIDNGQDTGFRYAPISHPGQTAPIVRYKMCQLLNNSDHLDGMVLRRNVCIDGNYLCYTLIDGLKYTPLFFGNTCYLCPGQDYVRTYYRERYVSVPTEADYPTPEAYRAALAKAETEYRTLTGDTSTRFHITTSTTDLQALKSRYFSRYGISR